MTSVAPANPHPVQIDRSPLNFAIGSFDSPSVAPAMTNHGISAEARPHGLPLPHVDDITAYPRDIDANQSIKRLLEIAEMSLRSAESSRDFKRPGTALKEYIKASYICVVTVKNHRDYPTLHGGWGDLTRKHNSLLKRIDTLHPTYEQIKRDIKADNLRTGAVASGTKPTALPHTGGSQTSSVDLHEMNLTKTQQNRQSQPPLNFHGKAKPTIHPKPEALHGNAITNGHTRSSSSMDLSRDIIALRLAALRGPQSSPGQDPRIKTHPIVPPKPAGPRSMPTNGKPKIGLDSSVPSLPRMPDAIYSPVRGTVSEEAAKLPSSTPRGLFSRTGSSTSITSSINTPTQQSYGGDSFPSPKSGTAAKPFHQRSIGLASATSSPRPSLDTSPGETITTERLYELMKARVSILIVDIRAREDFDEGHIMSTSTICIEPDILTRENPTCDQISESLILSPNQEKDLFDRRNEYDLVVICDQNAGSVPRLPRSQSDFAIISIFRALVHLNYGRELKQSPRLLEGGIEAWIDFLGPSALQSTSAASANTARLRLGNQGPLGRRRSKYVGKPMKPDDVRAWQETVNQDDEMVASSPSFHRTTEDFIRRYPAVSLEQESMTSPVVQPLQLPGPPHGPTGPSGWHKDAPIPPTRPDPAMQRPSYNGLSQASGQNGDVGPALAPGRGNSAMDGQRLPVEKTYTALNNPGNWCYANSVLQALFASFFARALRDQTWKSKFKVPMKQDEKIPQPQLMMQILANLFHWMSTGNFKVMKAHTLMNYSQHVTKQMRHAQVFGTHQQHDAHEFLQFMLEQIDDETNRKRDKEGYPETPAIPQGREIFQCADIAKSWWAKYSTTHDSIVDEHFRFIRATDRKCPNCNDQTWDWAPDTFISCPLSQGVTSLVGALAEIVKDQMMFTCEKCKHQVAQQHRIHFYHLPSILCFVLQRHELSFRRKITFELDNFDLSSLGTAPEGASNIYECFAIVKHVGQDMSSGHYTCFVRAPGSSSPNSWILFNDAATPKIMSTKDILNGHEHVFEHAYIMMYRRKDASNSGC